MTTSARRGTAAFAVGCCCAGVGDGDVGLCDPCGFTVQPAFWIEETS